MLNHYNIMLATTTTNQKYSEQEYFDLLAKSDRKIEYLDGTLRMMAGGTIAHNDIIDNTFGALWSQRGKCKVKNSENAVAISQSNSYLFPDLTVTCQKPEYLAGPGIAKLINPQLIIEVLSKNTAEYDRTDKFTAYRKLDSFKEYILIDSLRMRIDTYYRETNQYWHIGSYYEPGHEVDIRTLGIKLPIEVFYEDVIFDNEEEK